MRKKRTSRKTWRFEMKCGHFEDRAGFVAFEIDPKRIDLSRNGPQVGWYCSPHNWSIFQIRQKQQVVILKEMYLCSPEIRKLTIPEISWTQAPANSCSLTYAWHFSDRFLWENYSTRTGGHHCEQTTGNATLIDRSVKAGLGCSGDRERFSLAGSLYSV